MCFNLTCTPHIVVWLFLSLRLCNVLALHHTTSLSQLCVTLLWGLKKKGEVTEKDGWSQRRTGELGLWELKDGPKSSTYTQLFIWLLMYRAILQCISHPLSSARFSMIAHFMLVCVAVIVVCSVTAVWLSVKSSLVFEHWLRHTRDTLKMTVSHHVSYLVLSKINQYSNEHVHSIDINTCTFPC